MEQKCDNRTRQQQPQITQPLLIFPSYIGETLEDPSSSCLFPHGTFSLHSWRSHTGRTQRAGLTEQAQEEELPSTAFPTPQSLSHGTSSHSMGTAINRSPSPLSLPFVLSHLTLQSEQFSLSSLWASLLLLPGIFSCVRSSRLDPCPPQPWIPPQGNQGTKRLMTQCFTPKPTVTLSPL